MMKAVMNCCRTDYPDSPFFVVFVISASIEHHQQWPFQSRRVCGVGQDMGRDVVARQR